MVAIATMRYCSGVERIPEHIPVFIFVRCRVDSLMFPRSSRYSQERNFAESLVLSPPQTKVTPALTITADTLRTKSSFNPLRRKECSVGDTFVIFRRSCIR